MAMCNFGKNKITYTMDKNFNGDVVSTTNIMLPRKLYLCLIISNMSVASSDGNKTFDLIYNHLSIAMVENFYKSSNCFL